MIHSLAYDDRRLRDIPGDPLISTIIESAARQCGMGLQYDFWGVFPRRFHHEPQGFLLRKGYAMWATVLEPEAAPEMIDFLRFNQSGWVELDPILAPLWGSEGEMLHVMSYPPEQPLTVPDLPYEEFCATAVADCNLAAEGIQPRQHEASIANLHLAQRRRVGYTVCLREGKTAISSAAVSDSGSRYGEISYVATLPAYEGKGLGRAVVRRCIAELRAHGRIPLVACEEKRRTFYEELGFSPLGATYLMVEPPADS